MNRVEELINDLFVASLTGERLDPRDLADRVRGVRGEDDEVDRALAPLLEDGKCQHINKHG